MSRARIGSILVVDGGAGVGKSLLSQTVAADYAVSEVGVLPKFKTTLRPEDLGSVDGIPIEEDAFTRLTARQDFYWYRYGKGRYGFLRGDLSSALRRSRIVVVTLRDSTIIRRLIKEHERVITLFVHADAQMIAARLPPTPDTEARLTRTSSIWNDYDPLLYQHTILNHGSPESFALAIHHILARYGARPRKEIHAQPLLAFDRPSATTLVGVV